MAMAVIVHDCLSDMECGLANKVLQLLPSALRWNLENEMSLRITRKTVDDQRDGSLPEERQHIPPPRAADCSATAGLLSAKFQAFPRPNLLVGFVLIRRL
jgi:hypothetical protein